MAAFSEKEYKYLKEQLLGRLATVSRRHKPQVTPVGFGVDEDRIYLNIKHTSAKARNIRYNPRVSFVVDDSPPYDDLKDAKMFYTPVLFIPLREAMLHDAHRASLKNFNELHWEFIPTI